MLTIISTAAYSQDGAYNDFSLDNGQGMRRFSGSAPTPAKRRRHRQLRQSSNDSDNHSTGSKKAKRYRRQFDDSSEDAPSPIVERKTMLLKISDEEEVTKFYSCRFKDMQQTSCKLMGKAFVKLVEPRKQTHHPYTGGDERAPSWWPEMFGEFGVRHKEPDHLLKPGKSPSPFW